MKNKVLISILIICLITITTLSITILIPAYTASIEKKEELEEKLKREEQIRNAKIIVELKNDLTIPFNSIARVSDFIANINGNIIDDYEIDTTSLGEVEIKFNYINEENIEIPYSYKVNVVDVIPPLIWLSSSYSVYTTYDGNLLDDIMCGDDYDDNPICTIEGNYDTKKVGNYNLTFVAKDSSGNETRQKFTLYVKEKKQSSSSSVGTPSRTKFTDVIANYKADNAKVGIDVSSWQGDIDFEKVKNASVEFVIIRVGSTRGINGEYFVDKKFIQNIEGFNNVGIPVGIYFYSYANSKESAINDANWLLEQIKGYKVDLPIFYDWESWSFYNEFNLSFYNLTNNAKAFINTVEKAGYKGGLYSSKNYLEKVWLRIDTPIWLAHYTKQTSYKGPYSYWQMCSNGLVDGIYGNVDINIMYLK